MTLSEAATWLRVEKIMMREAAVSGTVPCALIGRKWRFSLQALRDWLTQPYEGSKPGLQQRPDVNPDDGRKPSDPATINEPWTPEKEAEVEAEIAEIYARRTADGTVGV